MLHQLRTWLRINALPTTYRLSERFGFHIYPAHYYSPLPQIRELERTKAQWSAKSPLTGIDMRLDSQKQLVDELKLLKAELDDLPSYKDLVRQQSLGPGYGEIEAYLLYAMIRHFQPQRIIEVGSGFSSWISSEALAKNPYPGQLTCIEPYPYEALQNLPHISELIERPVQSVDRSFFEQLERNDILFIDSSHTVKVGSDVNYLMLEILPTLKPGVIIHIHDIAFPYWSMIPDRCLTEALFPTEVYLVQAFLAFNSTFQILLCSSYLHFEHPALLKDLFTQYDSQLHRPSSLWLQRVK